MAEPREQLADALSAFLTEEQMTKLIDEILAIEKRTSVEFACKKCGHVQRQYGSVADARAVATALTDLLTQAYGRPGEEIHQREPITFIRVTSLDEIVPSEPDPKPTSTVPKKGRPRKTVNRKPQPV